MKLRTGDAAPGVLDRNHLTVLIALAVAPEPLSSIKSNTYYELNDERTLCTRDSSHVTLSVTPRYPRITHFDGP